MKNRKLIVLLIIVVAILIVALAGAIVYVILQRNQGIDNQIATNTANRTIKNTVNDSANNIVDNTVNESNSATNSTNSTVVDNANQTAISTFNDMFTSYEGDQKTDTQILTLLSIIDNNNSTNLGHKIELISTGITKSSEVSKDKKYKVELFKDTDGYVNKISITESIGTISPIQTQTSEDDIEKAEFNNKFISFYGNGEITGENVKKLIDEILASNASNTNHQIQVKTDTLQGISDIVDTETYSISLSYDENNWVNTVILDKKV